MGLLDSVLSFPRMSSRDFALWALAFSIEVLLVGAILSRRWYRTLPFFFSYILCLLLLQGLSLYAVYRIFGYQSKTAFYFYWCSQAFLLAARGAAVAELAFRASRPYRGFQLLLKWTLGLAALALLFRSALAAARASSLIRLVLTLEADLEFVAATLLVLLLVLAARYRVALNRSERSVAAGLLFYSSFQVINNGLPSLLPRIRFEAWVLPRLVSFEIALVIWLLALCRPISPDSLAPDLLDENRARAVMEEGTRVTRELADDVTELRKRL